MIRVTAEQLQKATGYVRAKARRAPVEITYRGRPKLVIISVEDYAVLRQGRKIAYHIDDMPESTIRRIAKAEMEPGHEHLNALMDE